MYNPVEAMFDVFRRIMPGAETHLVEAERHLGAALDTTVADLVAKEVAAVRTDLLSEIGRLRSELKEMTRAEVSAQQATIIPAILTTVRDVLAPLFSAPPAVPSASASTGDQIPLQPGSPAPSAA